MPESFRKSSYKNIGISEIGAAIPEEFIEVGKIAKERKLPLEYVNGGLGLKQSRVPYSASLEDLILRAMNKVRHDDVERFIIATESDYDISKAVMSIRTINKNLKSSLVPFQIKFACLAGVQALLLACEYTAATGKPAVVIVCDRSLYGGKKAEVTQGSGAVALRIERNARLLSLDFKHYGQYGEDINDFMVPAKTAPLPKVNGPLTKPAYIKCITKAFEDYQDKYLKKNAADKIDYFAMHTPFPKMVVWAAAALWRHNQYQEKGLMSLLLKCVSHPERFKKFKKLIDEVRKDPEFEDFFSQKIEPGLKYNSYIGNCYNVSIFISVLSLLEKAAKGEKIMLLGYGSGSGSIALMAEVMKKGFDSGLNNQIKKGKELTDRQYRDWKTKVIKEIRGH